MQTLPLNCLKCGLYSYSKQPFCSGRGNSLNPKIILIGEAPGPEEAEQGICFVGRAGKKLDTMLGEYKNSCYITNMVKCFPPVSTENPKKGFRAPKNIEIEYCKPFLHLDLVPFPHAILMPLGNIALKGLGGYDTSITKALGIRKQIHIDSKYYTVIPNFHPSYILRNPEKEKTFIEVLHIAISTYSWC